MNSQKAIEILTILESRSINHSRIFKKDALKLGIEALKRLEKSKKAGWHIPGGLLPGETED